MEESGQSEAGKWRDRASQIATRREYHFLNSNLCLTTRNIISFSQKCFKISRCYFVNCRIRRIMFTQKFTLTNSQSITKLGTNVNICSKLLQNRNVKLNTRNLCSHCPIFSKRRLFGLYSWVWQEI